MNKYLKSWQLIALSVLLLGMVACSDNDDPTPTPPEKSKSILIATTVKNPDGVSGSSYFQLVEKLNGTINNSNAVQMDFSASISVLDKDIFVFPGYGKDSKAELKKYSYTKGLTAPQTFQLPVNSGAMNVVKISEDKLYMPLYLIPKVLIINPKTMQKTGEIDLSEYGYTDKNPEASYGFVRDGFYYLPLNQTVTDYTPYDDHIQVDVLVIDTKTDKVVKMVSETSGFWYPTRPLYKGMIFTDEQNDLYIACPGFFGFYPAYKKSGFVCIPAGKQEFDTSKSWDISMTTIEGTSYKPASVVNTQYIGNGKVVAFAVISELITGENPFAEKCLIAVLMDLKTRTIKKIEGVPVTDPHSTVIETHNGKVILGAYGKDKVGFFTYDPKTGKVTHDATTVGNPTFMHFFE